MFVEQMAR